MEPKLKIIMIEDDLTLCEGWADIFEFLGYEAKFFHNAKSVLDNDEVLNWCDLLITDFYLPDLNGIEICQKIRQTRSELPIILLTGSREPAIIQGVSEIPKSLLLFKPIDIDDLEAGIKKMSLYLLK